MIIESIRIVVAEKRGEEMRRALTAWAGPTAVEPGCMGCEILQESLDALAFRSEARWRTEDDLLRHLRSKHYKRLLALMDLGNQPPLIEFHIVVDTQGLDLIKRARNGT